MRLTTRWSFLITDKIVELRIDLILALSISLQKFRSISREEILRVSPGVRQARKFRSLPKLEMNHWKKYVHTEFALTARGDALSRTI